MAPLKILICGGGISGPALAFWLSRAGHCVVIVERFPALRATGAQIDLRAQGIQVVKRMGLEQSIRDIEARFNAQYQYPYVFLNDEEFTDEFKACVIIMFIKGYGSANGLLQARAGAHRRTSRVWCDTKRALEPARLDRRGACARVAQEDEA